MTCNANILEERLNGIVDRKGCNADNLNYIRSSIRQALRHGVIEPGALAEVFGCEVRHVKKEIKSKKHTELAAACRGLGFGTK